MEEDIKILEEFIEAYRIAEEVLDGDVIQAIENLIARYKELERKYKDLNWYFENQKDNFIPKLKVQEKIEEISGMNEIGDIEREIYNRNEYAIEILLELLDD